MASFGVDRCHEELANVVPQARALGVPFEVSSSVEPMYRRALARYGAADGELLAVALLEEEAGVELR
jgi:3-hydroxyisobutyrate dehydrogenase